MAAEEVDGPWLRAGFGAAHDGRPEAPRPGAESSWSWRWGVPVRPDETAATETRSDRCSQQNTSA